MIDLLSLQYCFRKPVEPEIREKQADSGDHGHHPKVSRCQEPSQYDGADDLYAKHHAAGEHRRPSTLDGKPTQSARPRRGPEGAPVVERPQTERRTHPAPGIA
jgi:hypothetical protein